MRIPRVIVIVEDGTLREVVSDLPIVVATVDLDAEADEPEIVRGFMGPNPDNTFHLKPERVEELVALYGIDGPKIDAPAAVLLSLPLHPADAQQYLETGGVRCPKRGCHNYDINAGTPYDEGGYIYRKVQCNACGFAWLDYYHMTGIGVPMPEDDLQVVSYTRDDVTLPDGESCAYTTGNGMHNLSIQRLTINIVDEVDISFYTSYSAAREALWQYVDANWDDEEDGARSDNHDEEIDRYFPCAFEDWTIDTLTPWTLQRVQEHGVFTKDEDE